MTKQILKQMAWLLCVMAGLTACKEKVEIVEVVRSIKTMTVSEQPAEMIRKFAGLVAAVDSSGLSFEVAGQVQSVQVDIGDRVKKGKCSRFWIPSPTNWMSMQPKPSLSRPEKM